MAENNEGGGVVLDRAALLDVMRQQAQERPTEEVLVPEWQTTVYVRRLAGTERDLLEYETVKRTDANGKRDPRGIKAILLRLSLVDAAGRPLFTPADEALIQQQSGALIDRLCKIAMRISGIGEEEADALVGESSGDQNGDSGSSSPETFTDQ